MTKHDPLETLSERLIGQGLSEAGVFERILGDVKTEIDRAVQYALAAAYPEPSEVTQDVYA
jgi:TPP-dependent pyruvate/acetoin dehydrogenase alpha subunit